MRDKLLAWGLRLIWLAAGRLGRELAQWITEAQGRGLTGRDAFEYVWRKAKLRYTDVGDWLLNLCIEAGVGQVKGKAGSAAARLTSALKQE